MLVLGASTVFTPALRLLILAAMNTGNFSVRRATIDDLRELTTLWQTMNLPVTDLQNRLTEFQVAVDAQGKFLGAVGMQIAQKQGRIHSEGFKDFALADQLRPLLWERIQSVATNHGLFRVWTQERAPFWSRCGMTPAKDEALQKLPAIWKNSQSPWVVLQLRDDAAIETLSVDKEFATLMQSEKQRTARAFQQARALKIIATVIALLLAGFVILAAIYLIKKNPQILHGR